MQKPIQSHNDLIVWQKAVALTTEIYRLTDDFPPQEIYGLSSQMRRAAVSIASNIAEGKRRGTVRDFVHFLRIAHGSTAELETQLLISENLSFCNTKSTTHIKVLITEISKMLHVMIKKLGQ